MEVTTDIEKGGTNANQSRSTDFGRKERRPKTKLSRLEAEIDGPSRQMNVAQVLTSTKLPSTNRVTPPLVTLLINDRVSVYEVMTRIWTRRVDTSNSFGSR